MIFARKTFGRLDKAFGILFLLLLAFVGLHISTVTEMGRVFSSGVPQIQMAANLQQFRALERDLQCCLDHLRRESLDVVAKASVLDRELENIEGVLHELVDSPTQVFGLTRLVEPYIYIRDVRRKIVGEPDNIDVLLEPGGETERALEATLFVVRNNVTRLGEEQSTVIASMNGFGRRTTQIALLGGLAALLVFAPVRILAGRAAAKPLRELKEATRALTEERWTTIGSPDDSDDAVGDLVDAFNTMATQLHESRMERASTFQHTLASLVKTIEAKDAYVSDHSSNVSKLSEQLARARGLSDSEIKEITCAGLLHDIGKIGIPDKIINKPGRLTSEEFKAIEQHPVIGDKIVSPLDGSEVLLPPVRHHHEHWDGTGYPDGLRGTEIPLAARIISVADIFEALTSDRPYRDRMSLNDALHVLIYEAGKKLDPKLVDIFISCVVPKIADEYSARTKTDSSEERDIQTASTTAAARQPHVVESAAR